MADESPQALVKRAREMLLERSPQVPMTAENLNRAMLAMRSADGGSSATYEMDLEGEATRPPPRAQRQAQPQASRAQSSGRGPAERTVSPASVDAELPMPPDGLPALPGTPAVAAEAAESDIVARILSSVGGTRSPTAALPAAPDPGPGPEGGRPRPKPTGLKVDENETGAPDVLAGDPTVPNIGTFRNQGRSKPDQGYIDTQAQVTAAGSGTNNPFTQAREQAWQAGDTSAERQGLADGRANSTFSPLDVLGAGTAGGRALIGGLLRQVMPSPTPNQFGPPTPPPVAPPTNTPMAASHPSISPLPGRPVAPSLARSPATASTGPAASEGELLRILQQASRTGRGDTAATPPTPVTPPPSNALPPQVGVPGNRLAPQRAGPPAPRPEPNMPTSAPNPYRMESNVGNPTATPATSVAQGPVRPATPQSYGPPAPAGTGGPQFGPPSPQGMTPGMYAQQGARAETAPRMQPQGQAPQQSRLQSMVQEQGVRSEVVRRMTKMFMQRGMARQEAEQAAIAEVAKRGSR